MKLKYKHRVLKSIWLSFFLKKTVQILKFHYSLFLEMITHRHGIPSYGYVAGWSKLNASSSFYKKTNSALLSYFFRIYLM